MGIQYSQTQAKTVKKTCLTSLQRLFWLGLQYVDLISATIITVATHFRLPATVAKGAWP
jgi:hypothetical protein